MSHPVPRSRAAAWLLAATLLAAPLPASAQQQSPTPEADKLFADKKWKEAGDAYAAFAQANPKAGRAWYRLAYSRHSAGEYRPAAEAFEKAAGFPAFRTLALYNLGCARARLGEKDAAFDALAKAIDAGFADQATLEKDDDLAGLRDDARWKKTVTASGERERLYRAFDFWVGEWDVFNPQGQKVGTNSITKIEGGHVVLEKWTNAQGNTGTSMNFVDPVDKKWKQVWVDQGGGVVRYEGEFKDGAMRFTGTTVPKAGPKALTRASFAPLPEGKVRQFIEVSADDGKTWTVAFDGTYVPKKKAE